MESDIEEELALPKELSSLSTADKRELYEFKQTHNEVEWEEELLRRTDLFRKYKDLEELNKMRSQGVVEKPKPKPKVKPKAKKTSKPAQRRKVTRVDSDEESLMEVESEEESDDDWFDNDEVERITAQTTTKERPLGRKSREKEEEDSQPKKNQSRLDEHSDESGDGYYSDDNTNYGKKSLKKSVDKIHRVRKPIAEKAPSPEATLEDMLRIQLRRQTIASLLNEPYFEEVMRDSFVRVYSHSDPNTNTPIYKACKVQEIKPYKSEYPVEKRMCNKVMVLDDGTGKYQKWMNIKISLVSNSRITPIEYDTYHRHVLDSKGDVQMLTKDDVEEVRQKNVRASQRVLEEKDVLKAVRSSAGKSITLFPL